MKAVVVAFLLLRTLTNALWGATIGIGAFVMLYYGTTSGALGAKANTVSLGAAASGGALLTNGAFTFSNPIQVGPNPSSGTNSIGGNTDSNSTFSGAIALSGDQVVIKEHDPYLVEIMSGDR